MESGAKKFQTFEDLEVYQVARVFRCAMCAVSRRLHIFEKFELASQIRRASVSLTNNIAEGHGRWHWLDHIKFVLQSRGSLQELIDDLNVCEDEKYLAPDEISQLKRDGWRVLQLINGYLRYLRERKVGSDLQLRETPPSYANTDDDLEQWLANLPIEPLSTHSTF